MAQQSYNNGPLGDKFNDFEFSPSNNLFDGIQNGLSQDPEVGSLSDKFENYSTKVSGKVWVDIEKELHPKKKRRAIIWWGAAAGLAVVLSLTFFSEFNYEGRGDLTEIEKENEILVSSISKVVKPDDISQSAIKNSLNIEKAENELSSNFQIELKKNGSLPSNYSIKQGGYLSEKELSVKTNSILKEGVISSNNLSRLILIEPLKTPTLLSLSENIFKDNSVDLAAELLQGCDEDEGREALIKHGLSTVTGSLFSVSRFNQISRESDGALMSVDVSNENLVGNISLDGNNLTLTPMAISNQSFSIGNFNSEARFKNYGTPISIGALYQRKFSEKIAFSTGLMYTSITYQYSSGVWSDYERRGKEQYLSIPANLTVNLLKKSKFKLFPLIGGQIDLGLNGKDDVNYNESSNSKLKQTNPGTQISILSGGGLSFDLTSKLSLFGQSVFQYYVSTSDYSYFSETPKAISYQGGIKFSF